MDFVRAQASYRAGCYPENMRKAVWGVSLSLVLAAAAPAQAFAAEPEDISAVLLNQALELYGVDGVDDALVAELEASLVDAFEADVLATEVVETAESVLDAGESDATLVGALEANQGEQEQAWEEEADVLRSAFSTVAQLFDECRSTDGECQLEYSSRFRASWVNLETDRLVQLEQQVESLTGEAKTRAEERLAARVEKLDAVVSGTSPNSTRGNSSNAPGQAKKSSSDSTEDDAAEPSPVAPAEPSNPEPEAPAESPAPESPGNSGSAPGQESKSDSSPGKSESKGNSSNAGKGDGKSGE